jgi:hypothetical protein
VLGARSSSSAAAAMTGPDGQPRLVSSYAGEIEWIGPRYETGVSVVILVMTADDPSPGACLSDRLEGPDVTIVVPVQVSGAETSSSAARIVAVYRWLVAQQTEPRDIVLIACRAAADPTLEAAARLRHSGDDYLGDVVILDPCPVGPLSGEP